MHCNPNDCNRCTVVQKGHNVAIEPVLVDFAFTVKYKSPTLPLAPASCIPRGGLQLKMCYVLSMRSLLFLESDLFDEARSWAHKIQVM